MRKIDYGELGVPDESRNINELLEKLKSPRVRPRLSAQQAFVEIGEPAVLPLVDLLENIEAWHNMNFVGAVMALGQIGDVRAIPTLIKLVKEKDYELCRITMLALPLFGEPAITPIIELLNSEDEVLRSGR